MSEIVAAEVIHVDLDRGLPANFLDTDGRAAYLVFWWRGIPLGHRQMDRDAFPMPPAQLRNLAVETSAPTVGAYLLDRGFDALLPEDPRAQRPPEPPDLSALRELENPLHRLTLRRPVSEDTRISVVVCTRDRAESLDRCLQSLLRCSPPADEIVVVDNAPVDDATRRLIEHYPDVRYVMEPDPGLDIARNTGIRHSGAVIVAFVDDDVTVHPDWVMRLAECFADPQVMAATGLVLPAELKTVAQALFERHWGFNRGYRVMTYDQQYFQRLKPWGVPAWRVGAGANMAFRREVFDSVGSFDIRLDVGAAGCSGDSELWYRLLAAGLTCRYEPRAVVFHFHRTQMAALKRQLYFYMRGHTAALLIQFARHMHGGNLVRLFLLLPLYYAKLVVQGLFFGFPARHRLLPIEWAGCLSGVSFFLRHMRSAKADDTDASTL